MNNFSHNLNAARALQKNLISVTLMTTLPPMVVYSPNSAKYTIIRVYDGSLVTGCVSMLESAERRSAEPNIARSAAAFALCMFVFLFTEITVNDRGAALFGAALVSRVYTLSILSAAAGYLLFPLIVPRCASRRLEDVFLPLCACAAALSASAVIFVQSKPHFLISAAICMCSLGALGAMAHLDFAYSARGRNDAGRLAASAVSAAVFVQFIFQSTAVMPAAADAALTAIPLCAAALLLRGGHAAECPPAEPGTEYPRRALFVLMAIVALMSFACGVTDGIFTALHASGAADVSGYPRLFYPLGLIMAGVIADYKNRVYMPIVTACALTLSIASATLLSGPSGYVMALIAFYFSSGFYVLFFTISFTDAAPRTSRPALWAGMGRAVRCVSVGLLLPAEALFRGSGFMPLVIINIVLYAAILFLLYISGMLARPEARGERGAEELAEFGREYGLNAIEMEALALAIDGDLSVAEIAATLNVTPRTCERRLSSIYAKTGVQKRAGLIARYYGRETK